VSLFFGEVGVRKKNNLKNRYSRSPLLWRGVGGEVKKNSQITLGVLNLFKR